VSAWPLALAAAAATLSATAAPARARDDGVACRLVAGWDADSDLVAYEQRRDDCVRPAPAVTGGGLGRRRKSRYELLRISTGTLVDVADCEISFSVSDGEVACDVDVLAARRPRTFGRLRAARSGKPVDPAPAAVSLPSAAGEARALDLTPAGLRVIAVSRQGAQAFIKLARGRDEVLLRLPGNTVLPPRQWQRALVDQVGVAARFSMPELARALIAAARALGPLDARVLSSTFCKTADVADRVESWRAASAAFDAGERSALEAALARHGCFPRVDLAGYDAARGAMDAARAWFDVARRPKDVAQLRELSAFPLVVAGIWDDPETARPARCREQGAVGVAGDGVDALVEIADGNAFARLGPCVLENSSLQAEGGVPPLVGGRWPVNRGDSFEGPFGSVLPVDVKQISPLLRKYRARAAALLKDGRLVEVTFFDDGLTHAFLLIVDPVAGGGARVRSVFGTSMFEE
jgi:hypothetical protein